MQRKSENSRKKKKAASFGCQGLEFHWQAGVGCQCNLCNCLLTFSLSTFSPFFLYIFSVFSLHFLRFFSLHFLRFFSTFSPFFLHLFYVFVGKAWQEFHWQARVVGWHQSVLRDNKLPFYLFLYIFSFFLDFFYLFCLARLGVPLASWGWLAPVGIA